MKGYNKIWLVVACNTYSFLILERSFSVILDARSDAKRQVSIYHLPSGLYVRKELLIIINITLILLFVPNAAKIKEIIFRFGMFIH